MPENQDAKWLRREESAKTHVLSSRRNHRVYHEAAILTRLAGPDEPELSAGAAEGILTLGFSPADTDRMHTLAAKAREGTLNADEQAEVEAYSRVGSLLGILKPKARRALKPKTN